MEKQLIQNEIEQLDNAYKQKLISTNDYCTYLHSLLQKLKRLGV